MDAELRAFLEESAKENKRSLHAEIMARLYSTRDKSILDDPETARIRTIAREEIAKASKNN